MGMHDKNNAAEDFQRATYNSIESTLLWGRTGIEPLFNSFKAHVKAKDVESYWNLTPEVLGLG